MIINKMKNLKLLINHKYESESSKSLHKSMSKYYELKRLLKQVVEANPNLDIVIEDDEFEFADEFTYTSVRSKQHNRMHGMNKFGVGSRNRLRDQYVPENNFPIPMATPIFDEEYLPHPDDFTDDGMPVREGVRSYWD